MSNLCHLTEHLVLQAMNKSAACARGDEVDRVSVELLLGGIICPFPTRGELSRSKKIFGAFMSGTLPLNTERKL